MCCGEAVDATWHETRLHWNIEMCPATCVEVTWTELVTKRGIQSCILGLATPTASWTECAELLGHDTEFDAGHSVDVNYRGLCCGAALQVIATFL